MAGEYADVFSRPAMVGSDVFGSTTEVTNGMVRAFDMEDGGPGRVVGTVKEKNTPTNTPLGRRVILLDHISKRLLRETWSDQTTGVYAFIGIAMGRKYDVISYDHTGAYRGVVADNLSPELMT